MLDTFDWIYEFAEKFLNLSLFYRNWLQPAWCEPHVSLGPGHGWESGRRRIGCQDASLRGSTFDTRWRGLQRWQRPGIRKKQIVIFSTIFFGGIYLYEYYIIKYIINIIFSDPWQRLHFDSVLRENFATKISSFFCTQSCRTNHCWMRPELANTHFWPVNSFRCSYISPPNWPLVRNFWRRNGSIVVGVNFGGGYPFQRDFPFRGLVRNLARATMGSLGVVN